jgi:hypothetical protein
LDLPIKDCDFPCFFVWYVSLPEGIITIFCSGWFAGSVSDQITMSPISGWHPVGCSIPATNIKPENSQAKFKVESTLPPTHGRVYKVVPHS